MGDTIHIVLGADTSPLLASYDTWKQVVNSNPEYRDGYVMLAWYATQLGKKDEVLGYIQKIRTLDPNYSFPEVFNVE